HGQGHGRRPARGGLWRPARADGARRPRRRRLPGRHAGVQPPGGRPRAVPAGLPPLALLDEAAYICLNARTETLAAGLREAAADLPVHVVTAPGLLTVFFSAEPAREPGGAPAWR